MSGAAWEKQIHFQLSLYKKFYIFLDQTKYIECRDAAAVWVRHSAGLESVRIVPPGPVLIMFFFLLLQSANLNLLLWGEQEDEGRKEGF